MTHKEMQRAKRKAWRHELKDIESVLHPNPVIGGVEIGHQHKGKTIFFYPFPVMGTGGETLNNKYLAYGRERVLYSTTFYADNNEQLKWLTS